MSPEAQEATPGIPQSPERRLLTLLAVMDRVRSLALEAGSNALAQVETPLSAIRTVEQAMEEIRELFSACGERGRLFFEWKEKLTPQEYVLPPELRASHPQILGNLLSGRDVTAFPYTGLVLYGTPGTGKSEYASYLNHLAGGSVVIVVANISEISNSANPGESLRKLYEQLEDAARADGKIRILFFDEFDKLTNKFKMQEVATRVDRRDSAIDGRGRGSSSSSTSHQEVSEFDQAGAELFATLKTILSGTGTGSSRTKLVFTIATSNKQEFPPELVREGRLEPVELKPFGMRLGSIPSGWSDKDRVPMYATCADHIPRMLEILQATHKRDAHGENSVLGRIGSELQEQFGTLSAQIEGENLYGQNRRWIKCLLTYFGCEAENEYLNKRFAGVSDSGKISREFASTGIEIELSKTDQIYRAIRGLTPTAIAGYYRKNRDQFNDYDLAKRIMAQLIFGEDIKFATKEEI